MISNDGTFSLSGVHAINQYLWAKLSTELGMDKSKTGGLVPILPTQQLPQMNQYAEPFIIYNWVTDNQGSDWWMQRDVCIYKIYSEEEIEVRQIMNYMRFLFERHDETAQDVNNWLKANATSKYKIDGALKFHFKSIKVGAESGGVVPAESEGGRQEATVVLNAMYTVKYPASKG